VQDKVKVTIIENRSLLSPSIYSESHDFGSLDHFRCYNRRFIKLSCDFKSELRRNHYDTLRMTVSSLNVYFRSLYFGFLRSRNYPYGAANSGTPSKCALAVLPTVADAQDRLRPLATVDAML